MTHKQSNPMQPASGSMLQLHEIYYIIFRHKWMIGIILTMAILTAVGVHVFWPIPYQSQAQLWIKYVKESKPQDVEPSHENVTTLYSSFDLIYSEVDILTSWDLATNVAGIIGPQKLLAKFGGGTNLFQAAGLIQSNLKVEPSKMSDVINLTLSFPDPNLVQPILSEIIKSYYVRHKEVHSPQFNEFLISRRDEVKHQLDDVQAQLRQAKDAVGVISLEDSIKAFSEAMAKIQQQIYDAQAEWAGSRQTITELEKVLPKDAIASTNATNAAPIPPSVISDYQKITAQLNTQQAKEDELLGIYTTNYPAVQALQTQIAQTEARKEKLEKKYEGLGAYKVADAKSGASQGPDPRIALNAEIIKANSLAARIQALTNQLATVQSNARKLVAQEGNIRQLEQDRTEHAQNLMFYSKKLDESAAANAIEGNYNISELEYPTPPSKDVLAKKLNKVVLGILIGGLVLALGLPFLIELYLDRTLKHASDVQARIPLPFFISIPQLAGENKTSKKKKLALPAGKKVPLLAAKSGGNGVAATAEADGNVTVPPPASTAPEGQIMHWDGNERFLPFYETLRDRLMTYFEMINLTAKPKLVAVTSCGKGAGVTSTAAGLAQSLSETGDGNVLLVDMNVRDGEAHHFYKGQLTCGLDEVLEKDTRKGALVGDNLYVARELESDQKLPRILPKRFNHLLPKMKASDFDYIIFDMPPVSEISITPRLARFMDMVLLVVESEKTNREHAKRAATLLAESKTNVGVILNKSRSYVPRQLHHDI